MFLGVGEGDAGLGEILGRLLPDTDFFGKSLFGFLQGVGALLDLLVEGADALLEGSFFLGSFGAFLLSQLLCLLEGFGAFGDLIAESGDALVEGSFFFGGACAFFCSAGLLLGELGFFSGEVVVGVGESLVEFGEAIVEGEEICLGLVEVGGGKLELLDGGFACPGFLGCALVGLLLCGDSSVVFGFKIGVALFGSLRSEERRVGKECRL